VHMHGARWQIPWAARKC